MIEIKNNIVKITNAESADYDKGKNIFEFRDDCGNEIVLGMEIINFAINIIIHCNKIKTLKQLMKII